MASWLRLSLHISLSHSGQKQQKHKTSLYLSPPFLHNLISFSSNLNKPSLSLNKLQITKKPHKQKTNKPQNTILQDIYKKSSAQLSSIILRRLTQSPSPTVPLSQGTINNNFIYNLFIYLFIDSNIEFRFVYRVDGRIQKQHQYVVV